MSNGILIGAAALFGVWLGWWAVPVVVAAVLAVWMINRSHLRPLLITAIVFAAIGAWRAPDPGPVHIPADLGVSTAGVGRVESFPKPQANSERVILRVEQTCVGEACVNADACVVAYVPTSTRPLARGDYIRVDWNIETLAMLESGYRSYVEGLGCAASARATRVEVQESGPALFRWLAEARMGIGNSLSSVFSGDVAALATGIVTGDDSGLSDDTRDAFRLTGTSHVTAVSGQNVSLIMVFLTWWWKPATPFWRWMLNAFVIASVWMYAMLVGLEPPALRAAIMATLMVLGGNVGRRPDPLTLLALTLGGMALVEPAVVGGVGFWLSASATLGLILVMPVTRPDGFGQTFNALVVPSTVAGLATMPITIVTFHTWSPLSILANVVLTPIMTLAFPLCYIFTAMSLISQPLASGLSFAPAIVLDAALSVVNRIAPVANAMYFGELRFVTLFMLTFSIAIVILLWSRESERWIAKLLRIANR